MAKFDLHRNHGCCACPRVRDETGFRVARHVEGCRYKPLVISAEEALQALDSLEPMVALAAEVPEHIHSRLQLTKGPNDG